MLPVLLYGSDTWTLRDALSKKLDAFGTKSLRYILGISWKEKVTNKKLLARTRLEPVTTLIKRSQLGLFGHVARMADDQPPRRVLLAREGKDWRRPRGRARVRWADQTIKEVRTLSTLSIAYRAARDRDKWRALVREAT